MNYGELKRATMQLVFSDTIAGELIPPSYNNQADYLNMIPALVNDCQIYVATTVKRIPQIVELASLEKKDFGAFDMYTLPTDCWRLMHGGLIWGAVNDLGMPVFTRYHKYKLYSNDKLMIPKNVHNLDAMMVEYYRYPASLPAVPTDDTELDNTPEVHSIIPYYVAAHLLMYDDPARYAYLNNEYETRLARITAPVFTEHSEVEDVYGFGYEQVY